MKKIRERFLGIKPQIKKHKATFTVYLILRFIVLIAMVVSILQGNFENAAMCILTLALFLVPAFVEKNFSINLPSALEIIIICFIFAHMILGELASFYVRVNGWDTMLHTINGFLCGAVGFSMIDLLNRSERFKFKMSPMYMALTAFCFSMTVGVLWEFFEFGSDMLLHTDMQKDYVIKSITSVTLDPTKNNIPITIKDIDSVIINGEDLGLGGYLDIGLIDTMKDLIVNFIGAVTFSIFGFFYVKARGKKSKLVENFIPTVKEPDEQIYLEESTAAKLLNSPEINEENLQNKNKNPEL